MITRQLGKSDLWITRVGVGTAPIGSTPEWRIFWGKQDRDAAIRAIHQALDLGVNWIDTAPFYGWGRAEEIVGDAVRGRRDRVHVFTKCGTIRDDLGGWHEDLSPARLRLEIEASLRRLGTDYVDLYQFHDPDPRTPIEESWGALQRLVEEGKVRFGGLSNHTPELMARAVAIAPVASNQHQYSLLHREAERDALPFSERHGIGVLAWSPLASGFLVDGFDLAALDEGDFRRRHPFARPAVLELRAALQVLAQGRGASLRELAIAWVLSHPAIAGAIVGVRSAHEAAQMLDGTEWQLSDVDLGQVRAVLEQHPDAE